MRQGLIKWPGGKRQLLPALEACLPESWNAYHEPFAGGAALFWRLRETRRAQTASLSDANVDLIRMYRVVRDHPAKLIERLHELTQEISEERYLEIRAQYNAQQGSEIDRAAWLLYLNHLCFNGLYRVNSNGKFNVGYCHPGEKSRVHTRQEIVRPAVIWKASGMLQGVEIRYNDFEATMPNTGDFVYFDPPYHPRTATANFTAYAGEFDTKEHATLRALVDRLTSSGVHVMVTDHDVPAVRELYAGLHMIRVMARRSISCKPDGKGKVGELIITNYKPQPKQLDLFEGV